MGIWMLGLGAGGKDHWQHEHRGHHCGDAGHREGARLRVGLLSQPSSPLATLGFASACAPAPKPAKFLPGPFWTAVRTEQPGEPGEVAERLDRVGRVLPGIPRIRLPAVAPLPGGLATLRPPGCQGLPA